MNNIRVPKFAAAIHNYRQTGEFPADGRKVEMTQQEAQAVLDSSLAAFDQWQALDEGPLDLHKGSIGDVKVTDPKGSDGSFEATFNGNKNNGELMVYKNAPLAQLGATEAIYTRFQGSDIDRVSSHEVGGQVLSEYHHHVDVKLTLGGPSVGDSTGPEAQGGFYMTSN